MLIFAGKCRERTLDPVDKSTQSNVYFSGAGKKAKNSILHTVFDFIEPYMNPEN